MAKRILWERADGGISCGISVPGKEARMIEQWRKTPQARNAKRLPDRDSSELPDREFRDAWRANQDGTIRVDDVERAKIEVERERITQLETIER